MKKRFPLKIDTTIIRSFDKVIEDYGYKRSTAIQVLMQNFNVSTVVDEEQMKKFILTNAKAIDGYGNGLSNATISVDNVILDEWLNGIKPLKQKEAFEKMMVGFLNLTDEDKITILTR